MQKVHEFIPVTKHVQRDQSRFLKARGYFQLLLAPIQLFEMTCGQTCGVIQHPKIYTQVLMGPT